MKAPTSRQAIPLVALALKTVGIVMILAAILDMILLPVPFQVTNRPWLINTATQIVDRGIIPMIGIALLLTGQWIEGTSASANTRNNLQDARFWASILASVLGLLFLLLVFLHPNNVRLNYQQAVTQINEEATQAENQLDPRLAAEVGRQQALVAQLIAATDAELDQAVESGAITEEQATRVREFRENPDSLEPYLQQQAGELRTRLQTEIGSRREEAQRTARTESLKSGLRVSISSLLLAIGYIVIGWTGLKNFRQAPGRRPAG